MQQKTNDSKKRFNRIRKLLQKRVLDQTFLVRNAKRTTKALFNTIKCLGGDTQIKQQASLTQEETEISAHFSPPFGKTLADKLVTEGKNKTKNGSVYSMFLHKISEKAIRGNQKPEK